MRLGDVAKELISEGNPSLVSELESYDQESKLVSDIEQAWTSPDEITQDVREFLFREFKKSDGDDFLVEDKISAIENGIKEFRKITGI
jgi:hypothetical protein